MNKSRSCITGAKDGTIAISNLQSKELIYMFEDAHDSNFLLRILVSLTKNYKAAITCVSMMKDNNLLISSATDGSINVFDLERHERLHSYEEVHKSNYFDEKRD